jgi:hypothetical protein
MSRCRRQQQPDTDGDRLSHDLSSPYCIFCCWVLFDDGNNSFIRAFVSCEWMRNDQRALLRCRPVLARTAAAARTDVPVARPDGAQCSGLLRPLASRGNKEKQQLPTVDAQAGGEVAAGGGGVLNNPADDGAPARCPRHISSLPVPAAPRARRRRLELSPCRFAADQKGRKETRQGAEIDLTGQSRFRKRTRTRSSAAALASRMCRATRESWRDGSSQTDQGKRLLVVFKRAGCWVQLKAEARSNSHSHSHSQQNQSQTKPPYANGSTMHLIWLRTPQGDHSEKKNVLGLVWPGWSTTDMRLHDTARAWLDFIQISGTNDWGLSIFLVESWQLFW